MFQCDCCGQCCRKVGKIKFLECLADEEGVCKFLDKEKNLCKIYKSRPLFCNVDAMYKVFFEDKMTLEEFYKINYEACEKLKMSIL